MQNQTTSRLDPIFSLAVAQINAKWATLPDSTKSTLKANLPTQPERFTVLDWNARLSTQNRVFLEPCQALYGALMIWDSLTPQEQIAVYMAGIGPISQAAKSLGLIPGA